jgi:hypothetical protein
MRCQEILNQNPRYRITVNEILAITGGHTGRYRGYLIAVPLIMLVFISVGCASKRPVLYPNAHFKAVGKTVSERDIEECILFAERSGAGEDRGKKIAKQTAGGVAIGGAAAGAWGLVRGDAAGRAAAGAAAGGAAGLTRGALRSGDPDPVFRNFVQRCMRERGYDVIGWQ